MKSFTADWKTTVEDKKEGKMETTSQNFEKTRLAQGLGLKRRDHRSA